MTKTQAIKLARENVGEIYRFSDGYKYLSYDQHLDAHRESMSQPYHQARASRAQSLIDVATQAMGKETVMYDGGKWEDYI